MKNDKSIVLDKVREAMIKEELAIPLYVSHIEQTLFWSGLPSDDQKKVIAGLKILAKESQQHASYLQKVINIYNK